MLQISSSLRAATGDGAHDVHTTSTVTQKSKLDDSFRPLIHRTTDRTVAACTCSTDKSGRELTSALAALSSSSLTEGMSTYLLTYLLTYLSVVSD